jgi:1-phosphofructokinase
MILTVTPNPTIDRSVFVRGFQFGTVVRAEREQVTPSGKGVDASLVIHELGGTTVALGLNAGLSGRLHESLLDAWGIKHDFGQADGETRMAIVLVDLAINQQSTISAATLHATPRHLSRLLELVDRYADRSWGVICGGSLPPGLPQDSYAHLLRRARARGLVALLDSSGPALRQGIKGYPHILKVNVDELQALDAILIRGLDLSGGKHDDIHGSVRMLAERLDKRLGDWVSEGVVITLGQRGALAVTTKGVYHVQPPPVPVVNTAGAGDALNAGIMLALSRGAEWSEALIWGTAAAASVITNQGTAICHREQVEEFRPQVRVVQLESSAHPEPGAHPNR